MQTVNVHSTGRGKLKSVTVSCLGMLMTLAGLAVGTSALAQTDSAASFPERQVRIVVPFPAGGASDIVARLFAKELGETWKQTVLVENKPGASGHLGAQYVANAKPDGHTLVLADMSTFTMSPALMPGLTYNPGKELTPVVIATFSPHIFVVKNQMPVKTFDEFIAYAKAQKHPLSFGATLGTFFARTPEVASVKSKRERAEPKGRSPYERQPVPRAAPVHGLQHRCARKGGQGDLGHDADRGARDAHLLALDQIGRASCRERVSSPV